jgi:hypothetical protein
MSACALLLGWGNTIFAVFLYRCFAAFAVFLRRDFAVVLLLSLFSCAVVLPLFCCFRCFLAPLFCRCFAAFAVFLRRCFAAFESSDCLLDRASRRCCFEPLERDQHPASARGIDPSRNTSVTRYYHSTKCINWVAQSYKASWPFSLATDMCDRTLSFLF